MYYNVINHMNTAFFIAKQAIKRREIPIGAVIIDSNELIISANHNLTFNSFDPTSHAEILCIREATKKLQTKYLKECDIFVTLEPCAMCAQALAASRIRRIYFSAYDEKFGAVNDRINIFRDIKVNIKPEIYGGIQEERSIKLLRSFFRNKRGIRINT